MRTVGWAATWLVLVGALSVPQGAMAAPPGMTTGKRLIVMPRAGLPERELQRIVASQGAKARRAGGSRLYIVDLPPNVSDRAVAALLARNPHLEFAEPDALVPPDGVTNDPYFGSAWHLAKIGAPSAWDTSTGSGTPIAILDTGVWPGHPDLAGKLLPGWNFYDNNSDTNDYNGHGTRVAGTTAAVGNNGIGVVGTAIGAAIVPYRISDPAGYGSGAAVVSALTNAADRGIRVASMSFNFAQWASVKAAAQYFKDKGGLLFMSSGNTGAEDTSPPSTSWIVVSATDSADAKAGWATWGSFVSLTAPGVSIWTINASGGYAAGLRTRPRSPRRWRRSSSMHALR
jgi:thermitase